MIFSGRYSGPWWTRVAALNTATEHPVYGYGYDIDGSTQPAQDPLVSIRRAGGRSLDIGDARELEGSATTSFCACKGCRIVLFELGLPVCLLLN